MYISEEKSFRDCGLFEGVGISMFWVKSVWLFEGEGHSRGVFKVLQCFSICFYTVLHAIYLYEKIKKN